VNDPNEAVPLDIDPSRAASGGESRHRIALPDIANRANDCTRKTSRADYNGLDHRIPSYLARRVKTTIHRWAANNGAPNGVRILNYGYRHEAGSARPLRPDATPEFVGSDDMRRAARRLRVQPSSWRDAKGL
jgi:hypothetical protein